MVQSIQPYTGLFPVAPTPFHDDGSLEREGQRRVLDCMIDQGVDGICILANYSEQFLLTDAERTTLTELCLSHVGQSLPIMVTCSHFSTAIALAQGSKARCRTRRQPHHAHAALPWHRPPSRRGGIFEHFARVAEAAWFSDGPRCAAQRRPSVVPFPGPPRAGFAPRRYFKIEVPGTAGKLRDLRPNWGGHIEGPFDGEEASP